MSKLFVEALAICQEVKKRPEGVDLIGVFNDIYLSGLPGIYNFFSFIAVNHQDADKDEKYEFMLEVENLNNNKILASGNWQPIDRGGARGTNITTPLRLLLNEIGNFELRFVVRECDSGQAGEKLAQIRFTVHLATKLNSVPDSVTPNRVSEAAR